MCRLGYKVVAGKKSFRPATPLALQRVRYRLGETTTRDDYDAGPFAVFQRLRDAARFAREYGERILLVEYEPSAERHLWKKRSPSFTRSRYGRGYYAQSNGVDVKDSDFPRGTEFADEVTPLRVVEL